MMCHWPTAHMPTHSSSCFQSSWLTLNMHSPTTAEIMCSTDKIWNKSLLSTIQTTLSSFNERSLLVDWTDQLADSRFESHFVTEKYLVLSLPYMWSLLLKLLIANQLDLPSLTPQFVPGCSRLQLRVPIFYFGIVLLTLLIYFWH